MIQCLLTGSVQLPLQLATVQGCCLSLLIFTVCQYVCLSEGLPAGSVQPPSQQATRHARRIYVGGLPPTANEQNIATFFSNALAAVGGTTAGPGELPLQA